MNYSLRNSRRAPFGPPALIALYFESRTDNVKRLQETHRMIRRATFLLVCLFVFANLTHAQSRRKIILDQDARGPATTDQQSMLLLLQSPNVNVLGITIVSGDQWRDEEVAHTLRMLELTGHSNIKVYPGAVFPLINSKE